MKRKNATVAVLLVACALGACASPPSEAGVGHPAKAPLPGPPATADELRLEDRAAGAGSDLEQAATDTRGFWPENGVVIPYALHSDLFQTGIGAAFALPDWPHDDATSAGFGILSSNGSVALALVGTDWTSGLHERVLLDPLISVGRYGDQRIYTGTNAGYRGERAGEHDSKADNFQEGDGDDIHVRLRFEYVLPIGSGRDEIRHEPELENGILVGNPSGGGAWNPLRSGRTAIQLEPFYRDQSAATDRGDVELRTNGVKLSLDYDNTDYPINPTTGSRQRVAVARDFDLFDSSGAWTSMEARASQFFDLGAMETLSQQVLAFDIWSAHAFTWRVKDTKRGPVLQRAPPNFEGARLGGLFRLRAYDAARFSDRSALHYAAEYRVTPRVNPLDSIPLLRDIGSDWTQFVIFGEMGRVHESFDLSELHTDMKRDAGIGVRIFVQGVVIRIDAAWSGEGPGLQVMIAQPF